MRYISFPRELTKHQVLYVKCKDEDEFKKRSDINDSWDYKELPLVEGRIDGRISIWDIFGSVVFNSCFKNPFVYEFCVCLPDYYHEQKMSIIDRYCAGKDTTIEPLDDEANEAMDKELYQYWGKGWSLENQVLYKYLHENLNVGEFVEIYESWIEEEDENCMTFGPPTFDTNITLEELLYLLLPTQPLEWEERRRLTIRKE